MSSSSSSTTTTIYLGRIPHGFYEDQIRAYFSQFGPLLHVRLSRNKRTGQSKHYAFLQFQDPESARCATEAMHNYLLDGKLLQCKLIPPKDLHPAVWKGADRKFKKVPWERIRMQAYNDERQKEKGANGEKLSKKRARSESLLKKTLKEE